MGGWIPAKNPDGSLVPLRTALHTPEGDPIAVGSSVPPSAAAIRNDFVRNGGSPSLLVDGSGTPVVFSYDADATYDVSLQEIKFSLVANSVKFGYDYFGSDRNPLDNGVLVEVTAGGATGTVYNLLQNESFVDFASPGGFEWIVSSRDMLSSCWMIGGGLKLKAGTADKVSVTIRDDLGRAARYFRCFVKGNLLIPSA